MQRPDKKCVQVLTQGCIRSDAHQHRKIVQCVGAKYGQGISNELHNKATVNIIERLHTDDIIKRHILREAMVRTRQVNLQTDRESMSIFLQDAINATLLVDSDAPMKLSILENEIAEGEFERDIQVPI